jgi:PBSX family phage terminase large subunit
VTTAIKIACHPKQGRFVGTSAYEAAFVGGIGSGKSIGGCIRGLLASQGYIGSHQVLQTPNVGVITAPTYPMLRDATMRAFVDIAGDAIQQFNKNEGLMILQNGSEIIWRTASDPDTLRGPSISWWFGDEAAMYARKAWDIMIGRLRQFGVRGYAWLATTPRGRNWVWQLFVQDKQPGRKIFKASSADNIYLEPAIVASWRASYSGDFALQELEGEFIAFEGLIYPEFRREIHTLTIIPESFVQVIAGVDWGFANPGVILVLGLDGDGRMWVLEEHYQRQRRIEEWVTVAQQARKTWQIKTFYCDPSEPDYIKAFRDGGLNAVGANNTVNTGLQMVKNRLVLQGDGRPRLFLRRDVMNLMAEFETYQWAENRYGIRDEPVKANDHALDALRYGVMGVDMSAKPVEVTTSRWA